LLRIGETIDRYRVEALLGQGGMAAVYKARHLTLDSEHAIKVLFITAPQVRARLLREGRVQANLRHPNIVSVTDVLEVQGAPALVMEYVDGPALDEWLAANKPTLDQALWLFRGILRGISAAHERGVVHRDLKPANVLLSPRPEGFVPKVTDFGLVKSITEQQVEGHTQTGMALGTPEYMSPEQIRDASEVDQRSDMWALGCILYELVCHRRAFHGPDKMSTFNTIVAGRYEPPSRSDVELPDMVTDAIRELLVVDREQRLASAMELAAVLYEESESRPGRLSPPPKPLVPLLISAPTTPASPTTASPMSISKTPVATALGVGPTGKPAAIRSLAPNPRLDESPVSTRDTLEMRRIRPGRNLRVPVAVAVVALLGIGIAGWMTTRAQPEPETAVEEAPGTAPGTARTNAGAGDVAGEASAPTPTPAPAMPAPPPAPASARPRPSPAIVAGAATIRFDGDAKSVWLESGGRRVQPGAVPPGTYTIFADFGDPQPAQAGRVTLAQGDSRVLTCSSFFSQCK